MMATAVVKKIVDMAKRQSAQVEVTKGELIDDVPRIQSYGVSSNPPTEGADALMVFLGGTREQGVIIHIENRQYRVTDLKEGEVAIYDDLGNLIKLGREQVEVAAVTKLIASAPEVDLVAGASSIKMTPAVVAIVSPLLTHNGKNIGATHYHAGSPSTAVPV